MYLVKEGVLWRPNCHRDESIIFPKILIPSDFSIEKAIEDFVSEVSIQFANFFPKSFPWSGVMG